MKKKAKRKPVQVMVQPCRLANGLRMWAILSPSGSELVSDQKTAWSWGREIAEALRCEAVLCGRDGKIRKKDSFGPDPRGRG